MQYSVNGAKISLPELIEAVSLGETVTITEHGVPVAELVPVKKKSVRFGSLAGKVAPPPEEFYEPMSDEELKDWGA